MKRFVALFISLVLIFTMCTALTSCKNESEQTDISEDNDSEEKTTKEKVTVEDIDTNADSQVEDEEDVSADDKNNTDNNNGNEDKKDTLIVATNAAFPPYEYIENGEMKGIDIELAKAIAAKLGYNIEFKDVEFGSIVSGVNSGKFDLGISGLTVTDERKDLVDFSDTYITGIQVVIVNTDSGINSLDDLKSDGSMKYSVQQDTTGDYYASDTVENGGFGKDNVIQYKASTDAVNALKNGKVQAVIIDKTTAESLVADNDGLMILGEDWAVDNFAIAVSKDKPQLLEDVNKALAELKADGTIDRLLKKYI